MDYSNGIEIIDYHQLLNKYIDQGFSLETLSKVTLISIDKLHKLATQSILDIDGIPHRNLIYLQVFLAQLYCVSLEDSTYLWHIVESLNGYFHISQNAVANYIGMSEKDLDKFLTSPDKFNDKEKYTMRIIHLFTTFVRDMRFSVE